MKSVSFRDLQVCPQFKGMNEIEMLSLKNDEAMEYVLSQIGFDTEYAVVYVPNVHRDLQNKVALGFMAVGEISLNKAYIDSPICTLTERMIAAAYTDPSLTQELASLMGMQYNFKAALAHSMDDGSEELPDEMLEPDREYVGSQIKSMEDIRDIIRGEMYNDRGEVKTFAEYKLSH